MSNLPDIAFGLALGTVAVAGISLASMCVGSYTLATDQNILQDAKTVAASPKRVNDMFAVAGKGLLAFTAPNGQKCVIRLDNGLPTKGQLAPVACLP